MTQLDRQRLSENLLDQHMDARRRIRRLEETAPATQADGRLSLPGLVLQVLTTPPGAPASGTILLYAQDASGTVYLRAMDAAGTVKEIVNWT